MEAAMEQTKTQLKKKTSAGKKPQKWLHFRHKAVRNIAWLILTPYSRLKYGIKVEPLKDRGKRPYLIIMNHQTAFDQFFVGMTVSGAIYYIASEDIFSNGFVSKLIRYLVAPIPIKKQTNDIRAVMTAMRVAREGGTIALAPKGNRTYSGKTEYFKPSILALVRKLKLPLAVVRIEGGYGVHPRWSDVVRKGKMRAYVSRVVEPEEFEKLNNDELFELIRSELYVDETKIEGEYRHKKLAEYLERAMYVCPDCGLSSFESHNDAIECKQCGKKIRYLPNKRLEGTGFDFPFEYVADWYEYQCDYVNKLTLEQYTEKPMYQEEASLSEVIVYKKKIPLMKKMQISLYGDRITVVGETSHTFRFDETAAIVVLGKNKLNIYFEDKLYQIKGDKRFNALKYVNIYYRYKNLHDGDGSGTFLGL